MYTKLTAEDFRRKFGLSLDYKVEGFLGYGVWDLYADGKHVPYLKKALNDLRIDVPIRRFENIDLGHAYEFVVNGKNYWFSPVMGTAMMAVYAHTASILGSKKNVFMGTVGGLAPGMKPADFILPDMILGNENALKYQPDADNKMFYPDKTAFNSIKNRMPDGLKVWEGKTITCESILVETEEDVSRWSKEGYLGVEMEGGLIFALSHYFNIPSAALFIVSDNLIEGETMLHESHDSSREKREEARQLQYKIAVEELLS